MRGVIQQHWRKAASLLCLLVAAYSGGQAAWIEAKAWLSQILIAEAWGESLNTQQNTKPWDWADTWPVAKLETPAGDNLYVLHGTSGEALAFGPGLMNESVTPGQRGTVAIAGHRDSHFEFLQHVNTGDEFTLQQRDGTQITYRVQRAEVIDSRQQQVQFQYAHDELKLISCYPFNALASRGPLRYVLTAFPINEQS